MRRKEKIIQLIIEQLDTIADVKYVFIGPDTVLDANLISLNFSLLTNLAKGTLTVRGFIDIPLTLKAQYHLRSNFYDQPQLQERIARDLKAVSAYVNLHI